jgi:hypothetical protein
MSLSPASRRNTIQQHLPITVLGSVFVSPLAQAVYEILRLRVPQEDPRITYGELAEQLRDSARDFEHIYPRSRELYAALSEVGKECRRLKLPPLPALVVRADTRRPGSAYYEGKCTGIVWRGEQVAAWQRDLEAVQRARFPPHQ